MSRFSYLHLILLYIFLLQYSLTAQADDGSNLWLPRSGGTHATVSVSRVTPAMQIAERELRVAWQGTPVSLNIVNDRQLASDGFRITRSADASITIASPTDRGVLYGAYHLLRLQASGTPLPETVVENPAFKLRILNHWDNLDRTVERGYAGRSLWQWDELPDKLSPRYEAYARANASIGINAVVLNNVNASPLILRADYLNKVRALADVFRPYGLRVFLSVNFASPMVLDSLPHADPLDRRVQQWWKLKVKEIYQLIPDFGGFLVKANSEGQPGPCDYHRTHAEGANLLADALRPYKGIVMWRAFVYSPDDADRAKQAYQEFMPLDGQFRPNVMIQIKNGPVDFQPREPYSPLFTSLAQTPMAAELQITQEYLGHSNHTAYLAPMWKEFFHFVQPSSLQAVAGVTNIGDEVNWCGHHLAQANWYAFGRLAWNPTLSSEAIATEWMTQSLGNEKLNADGKAFAAFLASFCHSREAVVDYMMPLGLHHLFAWGHHYGPEPWCTIPGARPDWLPTYYHRADSLGLGFDRTLTGSNAVSQYPDSLCQLYGHLDTCPDEYLLWFHHVPWTHRLSGGRTLWEELCHRYSRGVESVRELQRRWDALEGMMDAERFEAVRAKLIIQVRDAVWWKDACLLYFQQFSHLPFPADMECPIHQLDPLKQVKLPISNFECPSAELLNRVR